MAKPKTRVNQSDTYDPYTSRGPSGPAKSPHPANEISENDRKVLFFINRKDYLEAQAAQKAANARMKQVGKVIKADLGEYQLDIFTDRAPLDERAYRDGEEAGLRGDSLSNPYNEASAEGQEYARGWHDGQGALFAGIKKKEEAASGDELIQGDDEDGDPFAEAAE